MATPNQRLSKPHDDAALLAYSTTVEGTAADLVA